MKTIFNFFLSFDKLMKEKLVKAFYWLALIAIILTFGATAFETIWLGPLAGVLRFLGFFVSLLLSVIILRLICEMAIALFRINDNLSPDGGKGETADVDLLEEARKAAEVAAAKAREAAKTAGEKTRSAIDKTKDAASDIGKKTETAEASAEPATKPTAKVRRTVEGKDITIEPPKKSASKKTTTKKTTTKAASKPRLKKDGTPYKKRGPKPKN